MVDTHFQNWSVSMVKLTELNTRDGPVLSTGSCENFYKIGTVVFKFYLYKKLCFKMNMALNKYKKLLLVMLTFPFVHTS